MAKHTIKPLSKWVFIYVKAASKETFQCATKIICCFFRVVQKYDFERSPSPLGAQDDFTTKPIFTYFVKPVAFLRVKRINMSPIECLSNSLLAGVYYLWPVCPIHSGTPFCIIRVACIVSMIHDSFLRPRERSVTCNALVIVGNNAAFPRNDSPRTLGRPHTVLRTCNVTWKTVSHDWSALGHLWNPSLNLSFKLSRPRACQPEVHETHEKEK